MVRRRVLIVVLAACVGGLGACAMGGGASSESGSKAEASKAPAAKVVATPSGHKLAKLSVGMGEGDVRRIMGDPTSQATYMTGKAWIPWYWGSDTHRTEFKYKGNGRVVFNRNRWSGVLKMVRVDYDPKEDGY